MKWLSLEKVWKLAGGKKHIRVRFCDWDHHIKYFTIHRESEDGTRILGALDNGEKLAFPKSLEGWELYNPGDEEGCHAV